jgi:GalNAc-alpha-(1->4)-GalNAc-alpha-(1->3)-diNAcBac-PP-undecaprenol alpha-1,4-N-acetyl-D-galactosaminyltransferase
MRLTLVIASLGRGGAERTASVLASAWAERGFNVTMITLEREDVPAYPLHSAVVLRQLKLRNGKAKHILHGLVRNLRMVRALRNAIRDSEPHVLISFMDISNILALVAAAGLDTRVIVTEHVHPAYHYIGWHWRALRRFLYHRADALVCVSRPILDWFQTNLRITGYIIPNPVALAPWPENVGQTRDQERHLIVGMGRLIEQKGFDLLLASFAQVAARHSDWSLKVIGEGPLRSQLEALSQKLNLTGQVEFTGALYDPFPTLRAADLFVFSSRFEGFGNALCEAMACGVPAISFDCPSGPSEIIRNGVDGLLVPAQDVTALAAAMDHLMSNPHKRARLAARAPEVTERFGLTRVLRLWGQVFTTCCGECPTRRSGGHDTAL